MHHPIIGTKYLRMSDEALCLDSASVARIQASLLVTPEKPQHRPSKAMKTTVPSKVARYHQALDAATARHERALAHWEAFVRVPFLEMPCQVQGEPSPSQRLFVPLAGNSGLLYADIMTGCLFRDEDGVCLSSGRLRIYPGFSTALTRKAAARYVEVRKPRYNADESEA